MKSSHFWIVIVLMLACIGFVLFGRGGCSKTEEAAKVVVEEVTGKRAIDQGNRAKDQLRQIGTQKKEQYDTVLDP